MLQAVQTTTTPAPGPAGQKSNAPSFDSILQVAKELGEQAGKGKDTQIKFWLAIVEGAYLGTLSLDPGKHGVGRDDATVVSEAYVKAQQGAVIFDAKADKSRKLISNNRKGIKFGGSPKYGRGQPMQTLQELVEHRQKLRKIPAEAKKLDDAMNMCLRYATAQLKLDTLMDDADRNAFAYRAVSEVRTTVEVLESIRKTARKLMEGKLQNCDGSDTSPEVKAVIDNITKRLTNIAKGAK